MNSMEASWIFAQAAPPADEPSQLLTILVALAGGGLVSAAFQFYKFRKQADREDDSLISQATGEAVSAAKEMLAEYRVELERAQAAIDKLESALQVATERVIRLESDLQHATQDRERLRTDLIEAIERRVKMQRELEEMRARVADLESIVRGNQAQADRRYHERPTQPPAD